MDAGPDAVHLGPISPELVLVDPVLAEQARKLLPDRPYEPRPRPPVPLEERSTLPLRPTEEPSTLPLRPTPEPSTPSVPVPRPRRWRRTVALAILVFLAGAATGGGLIGERRTTSSFDRFPVQSSAPTTPSQNGGGSHRSRRATSSRRRHTRRHVARSSHRTWAQNVLGVATVVSGSGLQLVWKPPSDSGHVIVLRSLSARGPSVVVYRGRATNYRDPTARPCTSYRYTIVNYDRHGHRSTGVPTSVVTSGCT